MVSVSMSLSIGLAALYFTGFSLNQLSIAGFVLALGLLWSLQFPIIKRIWTSSFILVAGGLSAWLLAGFVNNSDSLTAQQPGQ